MTPTDTILALEKALEAAPPPAASNSTKER